MFAVLGRAEHETARELGEQCLSLARRLDDPALLLEAHLALGASGFFLGQLSQAHAHLEQGIAIYDPQQHHALAFRYGNLDPGGACLAFAGLTLWLLGYPDQALERANEALTLAQNLEHPYTLARGLYYTTLVHQLRREWQMVSERAARPSPWPPHSRWRLCWRWDRSCAAGRWPCRGMEQKA